MSHLLVYLNLYLKGSFTASKWGYSNSPYSLLKTSHITSHHVMSCHVMSRHIMSHHVTSHHITSRHITHGSLSESVSDMSIHYFQMGLIKIPFLTIADMSHYVTLCHIIHMSRHTCHMCLVLYNQCSSGRR